MVQKLAKSILAALPEPIRRILIAYRTLHRFPEFKRVNTLSVQEAGLTDDGTPFVRLESGLVFHGYPPTQAQRYVYRTYVDKRLKSRLPEEAFGAACDIAFRYLEPESPDDYIRRGKYYDFSPGETIVEVGAFTGCYAMRAAELVGQTGRVIAIEAVEENFSILKKNIEANPFRNITVVHKAAWNTAGTLNFYRRLNQQASAIKGVVDTDAQIEVPCDTVDHILQELGVSQVDFVRIQVNGAEKEALEGLTQTLALSPKLLVAVPYKRDGAATATAINTFLTQQGYHIRAEGGSILAARPSQPGRPDADTG